MTKDVDITKIFNRQFERMKSELLAINMPQGYLTIISKYWDFARQDVEERIEGEQYNDSEQSTLDFS